MNISEILGFIKNEAFLLSAIPAAAIIVSFIFEAGYLKFYGVPLGVANIDIYKVIVSCLCLLSFFYLIGEVFYLVMGFAERYRGLVGIFFISLIPAGIFSLFAILFGLHFFFWFALSAFVIFFLYGWLCLREKAKKQEEPKEESIGLLDKIKGFIFLSLLAFGVSFGVGYRLALDKVVYFVVDGDKVLVEIYGDKVVLAKIKDEDGISKLTGQVEILSLGGYELKGELRRLGKLKAIKAL